jgi:hypothetical protein
MCLECGFYKGKLVIDLTAKKQARAERMAAKKAAIAEQTAQLAPEPEATEVEEKTTKEEKSEGKADTKKKDSEKTK